MKSIMVTAIIWLMACISFILLHKFYLPPERIGIAMASVLIWIGIMLLIATAIEVKQKWAKV